MRTVKISMMIIINDKILSCDIINGQFKDWSGLTYLKKIGQT